jgi:RNA polymerase sigma-70 factor (ECF subfamily)
MQAVATAVSLPPFWLLVEEHGSELLAHARRMAGADAEDVLQDALLRALRAYPRLRHSEHLRAWLYRITTNAAYDHHSTRRRRNEVLTDTLPETAAAGDQDPGGEESFTELIAPLADSARAALHLRFVEDLAYEQIGERLDCSTEAARQRVSTSIRALRERLA